MINACVDFSIIQIQIRISFSLWFRENNQHEKEVECDPCFIENIHVKATHFCKTCVDPEPLCDECAKQHTRQKTCRDHELCKDVEEFLKFQSKNWYVRFFHFNLVYKTILIDIFQYTIIMHKKHCHLAIC